MKWINGIWNEPSCSGNTDFNSQMLFGSSISLSDSICQLNY